MKRIVFVDGRKVFVNRNGRLVGFWAFANRSNVNARSRKPRNDTVETRPLSVPRAFGDKFQTRSPATTVRFIIRACDFSLNSPYLPKGAPKAGGTSRAHCASYSRTALLLLLLL